MKSHLVKRSVVVAGRRVTLDLEDAYWKGLKEMAAWRDMSLPDLIASIGGESSEDIASAIRLFVLSIVISCLQPTISCARSHRCRTSGHELSPLRGG
jgi:predicted DNA-binding ribbon-helix-helix protein